VGIQGLWMFSFICMQITAPMKKLMSKTIPMESTPSEPISRTYCRMNIRQRSGIFITLPMSCRYRPKAASHLIMNICIVCCFSVYYLLLPCKQSKPLIISTHAVLQK
jgi:hypothetical protein